jgi:hypothetical protein
MLFLDEVGELGLDEQATILRDRGKAISAGRQRQGGEQRFLVDSRHHRDLVAAVDGGITTHPSQESVSAKQTFARGAFLSERAILVSSVPAAALEGSRAPEVARTSPLAVHSGMRMR